MAISLVKDPRFVEHNPGQDHPECPGRLEHIQTMLQNSRLSFHEKAVRAATEEEILSTHGKEYIQFMEGARGKAVSLDPDTRTSLRSVDLAYEAAGACVDLAQSIAKGEDAPGMALIRPPGHHATDKRPMGFCLFNNLAVAANSLLDQGLAERVAIYDWDVHHGNGTQDIFYEDPRVLFTSTHQWPFYPGTGNPAETGRGKGEGYTINVPLPAGTTDAKLLEVSKNYLIPKIKDFAPDIILVSAGYDAYIHDPVGGFGITDSGFYELSALWRQAAEELCSGKIVGFLEGGYHLQGLADCVAQTLEAWDT